MQVILLSGGEGKRLWPLSSNEYPKQFIQYIKYKDEYVSMLQRTYYLISQQKHEISVITPENYKKFVLQQIAEANVIVEPESKNTFPAVMLGVAYSIYEKNLNKDDLIAYLPIDAYVDENFYEALSIIEKQMNCEKCNIGLIGIKATNPTSNYGYIIKKNGRVKEFIEKPTIEYAKKLLQKNALYNSGIFILRIGYMQEILKKYIQINNYKEFIEKFKYLPSISFDYEVLEKEKDILCFEALDEWMDIGTYENFDRALQKKEFGNIIKDNSSNITAINELNIPIKIVDANDFFIIANKNGILIKKKF